jgi:hypothetical protein
MTIDEYNGVKIPGQMSLKFARDEEAAAASTDMA